jgi:outer membrane lipoprotein SlyB
MLQYEQADIALDGRSSDEKMHFHLAMACGLGVVRCPATSPSETQGPPSAQASHRNGQRPPGIAGTGIAGTITAIDAHMITIKTRDGQTAQAALDDKTQYRKGRDAAAFGDLKVGDMVFVRGEKTGDNAWQAAVVATRGQGDSPGSNFAEGMGKRFIAGEVKSIDGTELTIQRLDGVTQKISVDEETSFRKNGESITLADVKAGDHVFGRGELKNGIFVPALLNVGQPKFGMQGQNEASPPR